MLSRACFTNASRREKERILQRWADLACDVLLSGQPWSSCFFDFLCRAERVKTRKGLIWLPSAFALRRGQLSTLRRGFGATLLGDLLLEGSKKRVENSSGR